MTKQDQDKYNYMVNVCHYTHEQALELIQFDKDVDTGKIGVYDDLTKEQRKTMKKFTSVYDTPKTSVAKTRKTDTDKQTIINAIVSALPNCKIEIVNNERELNLIYNERKFKLLLTATRINK